MLFLHWNAQELPGASPPWPHQGLHPHYSPMKEGMTKQITYEFLLKRPLIWYIIWYVSCKLKIQLLYLYVVVFGKQNAHPYFEWNP